MGGAGIFAILRVALARCPLTVVGTHTERLKLSQVVEVHGASLGRGAIAMRAAVRYRGSDRLDAIN